MLKEFLGRKDLDKHLDVDEAVVLGSTLHATNLSDGIKLTHKLGMIDGATYGIILELNSLDLDNEESNQQALIQRMKKLPSKVSMLVVLAMVLCKFLMYSIPFNFIVGAGYSIY
jgi:hypoxia up-regulated 1